MSTVDAALAGRIRALYDATTHGWVDVWGEHLHHGYYEDGRASDHLQAQVAMVDRLLEWGELRSDVSDALDAGCGVGGSSRHLARKLDCKVLGVTLSPVQRDLAERRSEGEARVRFRVADATSLDVADGSFDLVWALESAEHMPDKAAFIREASRLLRPGGQLLGATWCHRSGSLEPRDSARLDAISRAYGTSLTWVEPEHWTSAMREAGLESVHVEDWSRAITPFWGAVIASALTPKGLLALARGGWPMLRGAWGGLHMRSGIRSGLVRYVAFTARKAAEG